MTQLRHIAVFVDSTSLCWWHVGTKSAGCPPRHHFEPASGMVSPVPQGMGALTGGLADDESLLEVAVELYEKEGERDLIEVALELFGPPV